MHREPGVLTPREIEIKRIGTALHDLCQPLTTLQCRLEMAGLLATPEAYREAAETGLGECIRLSEAVKSMREIVRAAARATAEEETRMER